MADLFRRATHIDVDDLRPFGGIDAGGIGHHGRVGAGDLHRNGAGLAAVLQAQPRFAAGAQFGARGNHFGYRETGAEAPAKRAERPVGDARHRGDEQAVAQHVCAELHQYLLVEGHARGTDSSAFRCRKTSALLRFPDRRHRFANCNANVKAARKSRRSCGAQKNAVPAGKCPRPLNQFLASTRSRGSRRQMRRQENR